MVTILEVPMTRDWDKVEPTFDELLEKQRQKRRGGGPTLPLFSSEEINRCKHYQSGTQQQRLI